MCYAIPGKIEHIDGNSVIVDYFGEKKRAINELDDINVGDFIYAQGGYVIEKIPEEYALSVLDLWRESFFNLQHVDLMLSKPGEKNRNLDKRALKILDKIFYGKKASKEEILSLLKVEDRETLEYIYKSANFLRQKYLKNSCCVHGIIEISNKCTCACKYCGISAYNKNLHRYKMSVEEAVNIAKDAIDNYGFKALVLQSGEEDGQIDYYCEIIKKIREHKAVFICISFGEIGLDNLKKLYEAGARGLLMRFETSNDKLYQELHPGKKLESRLEHIKYAVKLGYLVFTGSLIGLPGQTEEDIVEDIFLAKELNAEMYSFGPFIPHKETPLRDYKMPKSDLVLKTLSAIRFVDYENGRILVTTAFETMDRDARRKGLLAGANSVMLNITPEEYRKKYEIYPNRAWCDASVKSQIDETIKLLKDLGRAPTDLGVSKFL